MFVVTLVAAPMPGVARATVTITPGQGNGVVLTVQPGGFASVTISPSGTTFDFTTKLEVDGFSPSSARAKRVPSDGGFHVQVIGSAQPGGRPFGIGHIAHSTTQNVVLVCDGPPPRHQSCPGSLTCDDYTLTC